MRRGGKLDFGLLYSAIVFNGVPVYWTAMILVWVFAISLNWFPLFGAIDAGLSPSAGASYYLSILWHAVLPIVVLSLSIYGESYLILRGSVQEVLGSDYVIAAKTRGLKEKVIASGYVLRNSLLPLVSILAFSLASLVSRVVLVEVVFGYPGVGDLIVDAVHGRDLPVLEGGFFYLLVLVLIGGLIGDYALTKLDPRIKDS